MNGIRAADPQSGHHSLDLALPLDGLESIEVLRGAGSALYGSDALGGVVNFVTAPAEAWQARLRVAAGSAGVNQQSGVLTGVLGRFSERLSFARDFSSGFAGNRDYRAFSLGSGSGYASRWGTTGVDLGLADRAFGAQGFYGDYPSWERTKTWFAGVRQALGERTEAAFGLRRHTDLFYLWRDNPQRYQNHHAAESWQLSLRRREPLKRSATFFYGVEGSGEQIDSSNLGRHSRARGSGYASLDVRAWRRFSFTAGLRAESYRGLFNELSPSLAGGYWAFARLKLRASLSRAYRLPTFTDLYYRDPATTGNPALQAETAWGYEGGAEFHPGGSWRLEATVFERHDRNGIDYLGQSPTGPWQAVNITRLNFTGLESAASWRHNGHLVGCSYTALRGTSGLAPGGYTRYVFNHPVHSAVFNWSGPLPGGLTARTRLGALERRGRGAYAVWDVSVARARGRVRPFVQLSNLTATRYAEIPGVAMPGRTFVGGLELVVPGRGVK